MLKRECDGEARLQVGPRKNFATAWAANAASICASVGLTKVTRLEASRRFGLKASQDLTPAELSAFAAIIHDRMTEEVLEPPADARCAFSHHV